MRSEIIQIVTCDNNDGFQHLSFHIFTKICFIRLKRLFNEGTDPKVE
jgi:hypothetical protein